MQDMQKEIEAEGEKEKDLYEKFECFCKKGTENMSKEAEEAAAKIEEITAQKKADEAEKQSLEGDLRQHKTDRATAKEDLAKATKIREKEKKEYDLAVGDTQKDLDAMDGAIKSLESGMGVGFIQTPAAAALTNVVKNFADVASPSDREAVLAFLSEDKDYAPQSGQIVGILKNMKDEMDKSLGGIVGEEEAAAKGFLELKAAKEKEIAAAGEAIESKTKRVGELAVAVVQAANAIDDATSELGDVQKFAAELSVMCKGKSGEWEERQKVRQEELVAISEAISVLNDDDALDVFKAAIKPKVPATINLGFLQKNVKKAGKTLKNVRDLISSASQMYKANGALNLLSHTLISKMKQGEKAGKVDMSVVIRMIDDMVTLLKKEQKDDEAHKDYCDQEFNISADEKKEVEHKQTDIAAEISEIKDGIAGYVETIANTKAKIEDLDKQVAEATAQRKSEHSEYTASMQLNEAAVQLIFKAKNRLQKFYNPGLYVAPKEREMTREEEIYSAAGGEVDTSLPAQQIAGTTQTVFIQAHSQTGSRVEPPVAPETFEGEYKNKGQKGSSVMALMDMLSKDLEKDMQEAEHGEKTAQKEYAELLADAEATKSQDLKSVSTSETAKAGLEGKLEEAKTQKIITDDQHATVTNYIADLHQSCDFIIANFELRRQARSNEMDSLTNAKAVLSGASYDF
jgi:hypothetical protein